MSKKVKWTIGILCAVFCILLIVCFVPGRLTNYERYDDFIELDITNGNTGERIVVPKEDSLDLLKKMNSTRTRKKGIGFGRMGYTYRVNIVGGCSYDSFIINDNDSARRTVFSYSMDSTLKSDIDQLFQSKKYKDEETTN